MRVFKTTYTGKSGKLCEAKKWYLDFTDHLQIRRRFPGFTDKRQTEALGRQIEQLIRYKTAGEQPDKQLSRWLENIPGTLHNNMMRIGLIDSTRAAAGKSLSNHLEDFRQALASKGNTEQHVNLTVARATKIINDCKFMSWSDISASKVHQYLARLRTGPNGISIQTSNFYLRAIKQFCKWMVDDQRANKSPVEHLKGLNTRTDQRHDRRALEPDEIRRLLKTTQAGPERLGVSGPDRAVLYRVAVETGMRAGELRSLKVSSFDLKNRIVTILAAYSKHRREDIIPLRPDTAAMLKTYFEGKLPTAQAFQMPNKHRLAKVFYADLAEAGIPYMDDSGRYADFHALRHTTGSLLAASGVHPKVAQTIMRHSTIELTMSRYSHVFKGQESAAIDNLPDLSWQSQNKKTVAS